MPATKHMANHLTRVPKLSVEASRTLIRRHEKKDVQNNLKDKFFFPIIVFNFKQNNFQPEIIILPCLTVVCILIFFILQNHIVNLEHMKIYLQTKTKLIKVYPGMQAMLLHFETYSFISTQLQIVTYVPNQKN